MLLLPFIAFPALAAKPTPTPTPINKSVCLDPGHGGTDSGAVNQYLKEKDINLSVGLALYNKLFNDGYKVFMTRTTDIPLSNADRYNYCNSTGAALVVSIHQNSSTNPSIDYTEVLYAKHADIPIATQFASTIAKGLILPNPRITNFADGVLIKTNAPAVLTESLFMSNPYEYDAIENGTRIDQETSAIQSAIETYFGN